MQVSNANTRRAAKKQAAESKRGHDRYLFSTHVATGAAVNREGAGEG